MRRLLIAAVMAVALPAAAQFTVTVSDTAQVNVDIGGVRCVDSLQVLLPAFDWRGGADPAGCTRETLGPGHVRITGTMADATPCATFSLDSQATDGAVDLTWELRFIRDLDVETVRLNSYVPCSVAAGKGAWFTHRPNEMKWSLWPAVYGDPGGIMNDWGFDWFGYMLPGDRGVRFIPREGMSGMYLQDGRQWGGDNFQSGWTLADKGTVRSGTVLRASLRLDMLKASELMAAAKQAGVSLLAATGTLRAATGTLHPGASGGPDAQIEVRNVQPLTRSLDVTYTVTDDLGSVLAQGQRHVTAPALGVASVSVPVKATFSGDYRLRGQVRAADGGSASCDARLAVAGSGLRSRTSLDGTWQLCDDTRPGADPGSDAPPPDAKWQATTVPSVIADWPHRHWYRRTFDLPTDAAGKRLKLHFDAANHDARVFVNGHAAGHHFGGNLPFDLDITDFAQPGSNELAVLITNWTAACTSPPDKLVVGKFENAGWKVPPGTLIAPVGGDFRRTGLWQSVSLDTCDPVHITNAFVQTSVRKRELRVAATVINEGAATRTVTVQNDIASRSGAGPSLPAQTVTLAPGEERTVAFTVPWPHPHLWSPDDPYLHRLATRVTEAGRPLDVLATRFGFREVWTDGPRFILNGTPMKLFATSGWTMENWQAAYAHLSRMKQAGTRIMRLHTQPWQEYILSAADEVGLLIVDEAAVYCFAQSYAPKDPRLWANYATHVRGLALRDRNHPSLVIYSLENEIVSCGGEPKDWEPNLGRLADIVREVDPTRLITCESDLDPAGKMDLIGMHYPREYWAGFTLYPDKSWWMGQEIPYIGRQYQWKRDKPLYIGEFDGGFPAWYPQYQAFWLGDEAYTSRGNFSVSSPNSRARREMIRQEITAYRYYGVTGMNPWFDADEVDVFGPKAYAPFTVAVREWTHHFWSGETIGRNIIILNDSADRAKLRLSWDLAGPSVREQSGGLDLELGPSASQMRAISFPAPSVAARTNVTLHLVLRRGETTLATAEQSLGIYPPPRAPGASPTPGLYLYDPPNTAAAALRQIGASAAPLADPTKLPADCRVLVIGPGTLKAGAAPWAMQLAQFAASGGSVICLAQETYPDRWLPVDVKIDPKHSTTIAFPRARLHPILAGIADDDLRFWRPDHLVVTHSLLKPTRGNFVPLIDAGGIVGSIDDRNGLNWTPLLEVPHGEGRYLLCQLPLTERISSEPVAGTLLRQLVSYANSPATRPAAPVGLLAPPAGPLREALDGLGVEYESLPAALTPDRLQRCRVLIAGGGPQAWDPLRQNLDAVRAWLNAGGVLWLKSLTPAQADLLSQLVGGKCDFRSSDVTNVCLSAPDALTAGLSNHELYWRDRPIWDQWTAMRRSTDFEPTSLPASAKRLTDPPALVRIPVGQGFVLLDQILWDATADNHLDGQRIASILLTNLGVRFDTGRFKPVRESDFAPLDLSRLCNLGFAGDPGAGWMGHPADAMAKFPLGVQTMAGAVFRIINPADNGGKSVIALRGTARPAYPPAATGIPVGMRVRALHFLHTCAWGGQEGADVGAYVVHYADGTSARIPLRIGAQLADWYVDPVELPFAQVAWTGDSKDKPGLIGAYAMRWLNPRPDAEIASLDFVSADGAPVPILIAASAEK